MSVRSKLSGRGDSLLWVKGRKSLRRPDLNQLSRWRKPEEGRQAYDDQTNTRVRTCQFSRRSPLFGQRLWPRGMKKTALRIDAWLKDVAPSTTLRRWFNHDPKKWGEFQRRYRRELNANPDALRPILNAAQRGNVALVYSSHDAEHNNAVVLKEYVEEKLEKKSHPPRKSAA